MNRRTYFLLPLLLLLAVEAGAGEFWVSPTGSDNNPGTESRPVRTIQAASCLAQMEAAMAAIEPLSVIAAEKGIRWHFGYQGKVESLELLIAPTLSSDIEAVRKQWHAAQRDCWRQP